MKDQMMYRITMAWGSAILVIVALRHYFGPG